PLRGAIANLNTFTGALARNSDKLDGIVEGLQRMVGAVPAKPPPRAFDLTAPAAPAEPLPIPAGQLVVADPTAVVALETQRILVAAKAGEPPVLTDVQWADTIPKLILARILQGFENARYPRVSRALDAVAADYQLLIDIRTFRVWIADDRRTAQVEFGAKVMKDGRVVDAQVFRGEAPVSALDAPQATAAMDQAFDAAARGLIAWTLKTIGGA
ncbi:MAG: membrane integrity-associated transporter subunit PqiC, partial [Variibacter sp.]|nr:membrane integrity-associated transporter subunit PqiC [Variibacter sp.]